MVRAKEALGRILAMLVLTISVIPPRSGTAAVTAGIVTPPATTTFGRLPLAFVPNAGQTDAAVRFQANSPAGAFFFTPEEIVLFVVGASAPKKRTEVRTTNASAPNKRTEVRTTNASAPNKRTEGRTTNVFDGASQPAVVRLQFQGANPSPDIAGRDRLPGRVNYFIGRDPAGWHVGLPTYAGIVYRQLYPGIDLHYTGAEGRLKSTYVIAPGADPGRIRWRYAGASQVRVDASTNDLLIHLPSSHPCPSAPLLPCSNEEGGQFLTESAPVAWQTIDGEPSPVSVRYTIAEDGSVGFDVGDYDPSRPLTIDPTLVYSRYLGGAGEDVGNDVAVDRDGNAYVIGYTASIDFPTQDPAQPALAGEEDVFVAKLAPTGSRLLYATYLGGSRRDTGEGIAVDAGGNAYLTGRTRSSDFPAQNALQPSTGGGDDAFIAKLNPAGSALVYSTYLGGSGNEFGDGIDVDAEGHAYATGWTRSTDFPTHNPVQPNSGGGADTFAVKLNPAGSDFVYATYLGGQGDDLGNDVAADTAGHAYATGWTGSPDFPLEGAAQPAFGGGEDAFIAKLNPAGSALVYSTFLGGSGAEGGCGIAVDARGNAYISGDTASPDLPTVNPIQPAYGGDWDIFLAKLNASGAAFDYVTYLGGEQPDFGYGMAVDAGGHAYVTGETRSENFPTRRALQPANRGSWDAVVVKLNPAGMALEFSTYLGGNSLEFAYGIALDGDDNVYIAGYTQSSDLPTTRPGQPAGRSDAFVAKISAGHTVYLPFLLR